MEEHRTIEVSSKHVVLRIILFAAAFILAVLAFTKAITSIGHKEPGWQLATASGNSDVPLYASELELYIYLEGSSSSIRTTLASFNKLYSTSLERTTKLFDSNNEYEGYVNLATINNNLGKKIVVSPELFSIISKAYEKTLEGSFNIFAGPLYTASNILENAENYDREYEALRIGKLQAACLDKSNFKLVLDASDCSVKLEVSQNFKSLLKEYEFTTNYLDFGNLKNTFIIEQISKDFYREGYKDFEFLEKNQHSK